jgi:hypothetical protein
MYVIATQTNGRRPLFYMGGFPFAKPIFHRKVDWARNYQTLLGAKKMRTQLIRRGFVADSETRIYSLVYAKRKF